MTKGLARSNWEERMIERLDKYITEDEDIFNKINEIVDAVNELNKELNSEYKIQKIFEQQRDTVVILKGIDDLYAKGDFLGITEILQERYQKQRLQ